MIHGSLPAESTFPGALVSGARSNHFWLEGGRRQRVGGFRDRRLQELLPQAFIDRRDDSVGFDAFCDRFRKLRQPLVELRLICRTGLTDFSREL